MGSNKKLLQRVIPFALTVLVVAGGGVFATTKSSLVKVCVSSLTGVMRLETQVRPCNLKLEQRLTLNQTGPVGEAGPTGESGLDGGLRFFFSAITSDADPGTGVVRFNTDSIKAVTMLYADLTDVSGAPVLQLLDTFSTGLGGGTIWITGKSSKRVSAFTVTGDLTDGIGYRRIPVSYLAGDLPIDGEPLVMTFARTGARGATGPAGPVGATGATGPAGATGAKITELSVCDGIDADTTANELCKVGMTGPGGGIVFFVDYNDQYSSFCATGDCNYFEASPVDVGIGQIWCSDTGNSLSLSGWANNAVGSGRTNTATADSVCTSGAIQTAADYSNTFNGFNADDWWLPSLGELMLMYPNLRQAGAGGFSQYYWSSTENDLLSAWSQDFYYGYQVPEQKVALFRVRPVRAF